MIFFDPTENRISTAIPRIGNLGKPMPGLERATGGDILITPDSSGISGHELSSIHAIDIARLATSNMSSSEIAKSIGCTLADVIRTLSFWKKSFDAIIIQRKSGSDVINSIPRLSVILEKMLVWTKRPYLVVSGKIERDKYTNVVINDRATEFKYRALVGALDSWQERGGYLTLVDTDNSLLDWLDLRNKRINEPHADKVIAVKPPLQTIVPQDASEAWLSTLVTFRGIGNELAKSIGDYGGGSLAGAIAFLSDENSWRFSDKPKGYGETISKYARERLGLMDGQKMEIRTELIDGEE